jgi:TPR repeat protein
VATKAAEQSYLEAQYHLGCLLSTNAPGRVPADLVAACVWLSLAAAQGDKESEELLESLQGQLTTRQLEEVKRRTDLWKQKHDSGRQS